MTQWKRRKPSLLRGWNAIARHPVLAICLLAVVVSFWHLGWTTHMDLKFGEQVGGQGDTMRILSSPMIQDHSLGGIWRWVAGPYFNGVAYRPVASISFGVGYALWELSPFGHRLSHLLLFTACAALCGLVLWRLTDALGAGLTGAALFPLLQLRSLRIILVWLAARDDLQAGMFLLAAALGVLLVLQANDGSGRGGSDPESQLTGGQESPGGTGSPRAERFSRRAGWVLALSGFILALGSKEVAFSWPALVTAWALLLPSRQSRLSRLVFVGAHWALLAGFWTLRHEVLGTWTYQLLAVRHITPERMLNHWAWFVFAPFLHGWMGARCLPLDWILLLLPKFWQWLWNQAVLLGIVGILAWRCWRAALAMLLWQAILCLTILPHPDASFWRHMWFTASLGYAGLLSLVLWQVARAAYAFLDRAACRGEMGRSVPITIPGSSRQGKSNT